MKKKILVLSLFIFLAGASGLVGVIEARQQVRYRPEMALPSHYPDYFDGFGRVDRTDRDVIVINDRLLKLSNRFTYATRQSPTAPRELIKEGDIVGFTLNSRGEVMGVYLLGSSPP